MRMKHETSTAAADINTKDKLKVQQFMTDKNEDNRKLLIKEEIVSIVDSRKTSKRKKRGDEVERKKSKCDTSLESSLDMETLFEVESGVVKDNLHDAFRDSSELRDVLLVD